MFTPFGQFRYGPEAYVSIPTDSLHLGWHLTHYLRMRRHYFGRVCKVSYQVKMMERPGKWQPFRLALSSAPVFFLAPTKSQDQPSALNQFPRDLRRIRRRITRLVSADRQLAFPSIWQSAMTVPLLWRVSRFAVAWSALPLASRASKRHLPRQKPHALGP